MAKSSHLKFASLALGLLFAASIASAQVADPVPPPDVVPKTPAEERSDAQRSMRAYLQLQEQLHGALLAIEQARQEADAAARRNVETLTSRLRLIEESITLQREKEMESIQGLNRLVLVAVGVFAGIGLLGLFCTGWLQLRAMNRLAEMATGHPANPMLGYRGPAGALPPGDGGSAAAAPAVATNARLLEVIERLEKRVYELEGAAHSPAAVETKVPSNGGDPHPLAPAAPSRDVLPLPAPEAGPPTDQRSLLLGKGQALMHLGQVEKALACFDEVLTTEPGHAEALVKKGGALERLDRLEEAIACYDRAIEANDAMTLAYLQKGGVCNRLERFDEALKCYEQALRMQEKAEAR